MSTTVGWYDSVINGDPGSSCPRAFGFIWEKTKEENTQDSKPCCLFPLMCFHSFLVFLTVLMYQKIVQMRFIF